MNKVSLCDAGIQADFLAEPPQDPQHRVHRGHPHAQVSEGQHGQEVEHGLVQARLSPDHMQHQAVPRENHSIDDGKRDGEPGIFPFQTWKAC